MRNIIIILVMTLMLALSVSGEDCKEFDCADFKLYDALDNKTGNLDTNSINHGGGGWYASDLAGLNCVGAVGHIDCDGNNAGVSGRIISVGASEEVTCEFQLNLETSANQFWIGLSDGNFSGTKLASAVILAGTGVISLRIASSWDDWESVSPGNWYSMYVTYDGGDDTTDYALEYVNNGTLVGEIFSQTPYDSQTGTPNDMWFHQYATISDGMDYANVSCWTGGRTDKPTAPAGANTPPDDVNSSDWIAPSVTPRTEDSAVFLFNWTPSIDNETAIISYEFIVNDTIIVRTNDSHYNHTFPSEGQYSYTVNVSEFDNLTRWISGVVRKFIVDTTGPAITSHFSNPDNSTIYNDSSMIFVNATLSDNMEVFAYNVSIWTAEYQATSISALVGTLTQGDKDSLFANDNNTLVMFETTGSPGLELRINYTGVTAVDGVHVIGLYDGGPSHPMSLDVWNKTASAWDELVPIPLNLSFIDDIFPIDEASHLDSGLVRLRVFHAQPGNTNHKITIIKLSLESPDPISPILHREAINLNVTELTVNHTFSLAGFDDGEYITIWEVVDSHTDLSIAPSTIDKNDGIRRVSFTRDDVVAVQLLQSSLMDGDVILKDTTSSFLTWTTTQYDDKVVFKHQSSETSKGIFRHRYMVSSSETLYAKPDSSYPGHVVSGRLSWIDFAHDGLISVQMEYSGRNVIVTVWSTSASPSFESIGGLNSAFLTIKWMLATTGPAVEGRHSQDNLNYTPGMSWLFNMSVLDPHGISSVTVELNGSNFTASSVVGDVYRADVGVLGAGTRAWRVHANDTIGLTTITTYLNHTVSKALGVISLSFNVTFPVTQNASVLLNCSVLNMEQNATLYVNGTLNASTVFTMSADLLFVCNATATGNYTNASTSESGTVTPPTIPGVIPGFLQPGDCPDTTTDVLIFGLLFFIIITMFMVNTLVIKLPIIDIAGGIAMLFYSMTLIGCSTALGGFGIMFGVGMALYGFLK